ncbi:MAG: EamA family transporter [Terriglobia bacterium]
MRTALLLAVVVLSGSGGDLMVTHAMKKVARGERWTWRIAPRRIGRALAQGSMWMGVGMMALAFFALITLLSLADVSFVVPATAANYIVGTLGAKFLLKERVSKARWAGMLLVAAGVTLVCTAH